ELVDTSEEKASIARALGLRLVRPERAARDADLVLHASGSPGGLATALDLAGFEATVTELSWYGEGDVAAPLGGAFHSRRLTLASSQVGHVSPARRPRWTRSEEHTSELQSRENLVCRL